MNESNISNNYKKWVMAVKIYLYNIKDPVPIKRIADVIKVDYTHPYFKDVMDELIENNIIIITATGVNYKLVKIDQKLLVIYLNNSEIFKFISEFIEAKTGGVYRY